jgi:nucleoid DNA-binding protein
MAGTKSAKPMSKSEIYSAIADSTGLARKDVAKVFEELSGLIGKNVGKKGPGVFAVPGLMKITVISKKASPATTRPDPFHPGQMMTVKAKPARRVVKIRALKSLKEMA